MSSSHNFSASTEASTKKHVKPKSTNHLQTPAPEPSVLLPETPPSSNQNTPITLPQVSPLLNDADPPLDGIGKITVTEPTNKLSLPTNLLLPPSVEQVHLSPQTNPVSPYISPRGKAIDEADGTMQSLSIFPELAPHIITTTLQDDKVLQLKSPMRVSFDPDDHFAFSNPSSPAPDSTTSPALGTTTTNTHIDPIHRDLVRAESESCMSPLSCGSSPSVSRTNLNGPSGSPPK